MISQQKIIDDLLKESKYVRENVLSYYNRMTNYYSDLFPYKPFPKRIKNFEKSIPKTVRNLSLDEVKSEILNLISEGKGSLAVDLWAITTMGFRRS